MNTRSNSFDFARFAASAGVLLSHHFAINGFTEPHINWITLGHASVAVFFFMSGYLIYQSLERNSDPIRFLSARILRIVPNLLFSLIVTSVVLLIVYDNSANIIDHLRYVVQNIIMLIQGSTRFDIAGVFDGRPYTAVNGSLWTLPYEVWCYVLLFLITRYFTGADRRVALYGAVLLAVAAWIWIDRTVPLTSMRTHDFANLAFYFFVGSVLASHGMKAPLLSSPRMNWYSKGGDASYGMYIFAWPVDQLSSIWIEGFWASFVVAFVVTVAIGYSTWHVFEKRCMQSVDDLAGVIRIRLSRTEVAKTHTGPS